MLTQKNIYIYIFLLDPVLLCNDLGTKRDPKNPGAVVKSNGHGSISVKEAVRVAQSNNFMGLVCNSRLLVSFSSSSASSSSCSSCSSSTPSPSPTPYSLLPTPYSSPLPGDAQTQPFFFKNLSALFFFWRSNL